MEIRGEREALDFFINHGLIGWMMGVVDSDSIVPLLSDVPATGVRRAALAWLVRLFPQSLSARMVQGSTSRHHFIFNNRSYCDTYYLMGGDMSAPVAKGQHLTLRDVVLPDIQRGLRVPYYNLTPQQLYDALGPDGASFPFRHYALERPGMREALVASLRFDVGDISAHLEEIHARALQLWALAGDGTRPHLTRLMSHLWSQVYDNIPRVQLPAQGLREMLTIVDSSKLRSSLTKYGDLFRCAGYDKWHLAYILGLPIQHCDVREERLTHYPRDNDAIKKRLTDYHRATLREIVGGADPQLLGPDGVTEGVDTSDQQAMDEHIAKYCLTNTLDSVHMEPVESYSPFDVVRYINSSGRVVQLVRSEFEYVVRNRVNPWSREEVPELVVGTILFRISFANTHGLPECLPLLDTIATLKSGPRTSVVFRVDWLCPIGGNDRKRPGSEYQHPPKMARTGRSTREGHSKGGSTRSPVIPLSIMRRNRT